MLVISVNCVRNRPLDGTRDSGSKEDTSASLLQSSVHNMALAPTRYYTVRCSFIMPAHVYIDIRKRSVSYY
jgi:hypothetical protein